MPHSCPKTTEDNQDVLLSDSTEDIMLSLLCNDNMLLWFFLVNQGSYIPIN